MAAGDIKGEEAVVEVLTAGVAITKGQLVHYETSDSKYDNCVEGDLGPFAVAIEAAAADLSTFRSVVWGRVEVALEGTADVAVGSPCRPGLTTTNGSPNGTVCLSTDVSGNVCGIATEACDTSANLFTMWVGRGGY